jgi:acyl-CoA thioesterase-1
MRRALAVVLVLVALLAARHVLRRPRVATQHPTSSLIVCFGDSLTAGSGATPGQSYPDHLATMLGREVINAGVPGDTTADALVRLQPDVLDRNPGYVCVTLGGNDLKNGVPRDEAFANLDAIVRRIQAAGALVVVGGIDIPLFGRGFDDAYEELAERRGALLIGNVYKGILGRQELMADPIHPNGAGYEIMARRFADALEPFL